MVNDNILTVIYRVVHDKLLENRKDECSDRLIPEVDIIYLILKETPCVLFFMVSVFYLI